MARFAISVFFLVFAISLAACQLERSPLGTPTNAATWDVKPPLYCPGDSVTVSWDFSRIPKSHENCRPPNGGFETLMSCSSSSGCPSSAPCLDGYCCRRDVYERPGSLMCAGERGCYPAFDITITSPTETIDPPVESESVSVRGERTVTPTADTAVFSIEGAYVRPLTVFNETKSVRKVIPFPETRQPLNFPFICSGTTPGWARIDMDEDPIATEHVRVLSVRNTGSHSIVVMGGDPARGPATLRPGGSTDLLNGEVDGMWVAELAPMDPARLNIPRCNPTSGVENPWPDLQIELILGCAPKEE